METTPKNAPVYLNYGNGLYASPPCVFNGTTETEYIVNLGEVQSGQAKQKLAQNVEVMTKAMLLDLKDVDPDMKELIKPDGKCREADGFTQSSSLLLSALGLSKSRWAENGEWRW